MEETNGTAPVSEARLKLLRAKFDARKEMTDVALGGHNDHDDYGYATLADYVNAVQAPLEKFGLLLSHAVVEDVELPSRTNYQNRTEQVRRVKIRSTLTLVENGEAEFGEFAAEGMDPRDKANLKANTSAKKYAIGNLFNLKTGIDPESEPDGRNAPRDVAPAKGSQQPAKVPPKAAAPAKPPVNATGTPPKAIDDSSVDELKVWIGRLTSVSEFCVALGSLVAAQLLQQTPRDWGAVLCFMKLTYQTLYDSGALKGRTDADGPKLGKTLPQAKAFEAKLKAAIEKAELDLQSTELFGGERVEPDQPVAEEVQS